MSDSRGITELYAVYVFDVVEYCWKYVVFCTSIDKAKQLAYKAIEGKIGIGYVDNIRVVKIQTDVTDVPHSVMDGKFNERQCKIVWSESKTGAKHE